MATPLLWIEDDVALRRVIRPMLTAEGYDVAEAATAEAARSALATTPPPVVLLDLMLPPSGRPEEGLALLDTILALSPRTKVVVLTGSGGRQVALDAIRRGAHDFLQKPVDPDVLLVVLARARTLWGLEGELVALRSQLAAQAPRGAILGSAPGIIAAVDLADRVAPTDLPVLITGENGTGKELVARRVHDASRRSRGPFVPINCGALPPNLLESTLFGHVRGAFTGADRPHRGLFVEADGGTLFLDEVGELEPATQVRLLRALESGEVLPVGADRPTPVDVRFVSATNRDLEAMTAAHTFRDDLYWRIRGIEVTLPPLRDRGDDILLLARHFLTQARGGHVPGASGPDAAPDLSPRAEHALLTHPWPGNLRELRHAIQRGAVMALGGRRIEPLDLGLRPAANADGHTLADLVDALERRTITAALAAEGGNRSRAAARLGLSRQGLLNKLARWGTG